MKIIVFILLILTSYTTYSLDNQITISDRQIDKLGIKIGQLTPQKQFPLLYAPAQVVVPPNHEYMVSTALAGRIERLNVATGDEVKSGQLLGTINSPYLLSLQRQFLKANNQKQLAWVSYQRDQKLLQQGIIAKRRWQTTHSQYLSASTEANEARQLLRIAGMSQSAIDQLATHHHLTSQLNFYSPVNGVVLQRIAATGERLDILDPVYRIANLDQLWLEVSIPQEQINRVKVGDLVNIEGTDITAKITLLGHYVNPKNQTILARAVIHGSPYQLRTGQNVNAQIIQFSADPAFSVPNVAIAKNKGKSYLFVKNQTGFQVTPVKVIGKQQNLSVITSSAHLNANTKIAIQGTVALKGKWLNLGSDE